MVDVSGSTSGWGNWLADKASSAQKAVEDTATGAQKAVGQAVDAADDLYKTKNQDANFTAAGALDKDGSGTITAGENGFDAMKRAGADSNRNGAIDGTEARNFVLNLMDQQSDAARRMLGLTDNESGELYGNYDRASTRIADNPNISEDKKNVALKENGIAAAKSGFFDVAWKSQAAITDVSIRSTVARTIIQEQAQRGQFDDAISSLHFIEQPADRAEAVETLANAVSVSTLLDESGKRAQFSEIEAFVDSDMKTQPDGRDKARASLAYAEAKADFPGMALHTANEISDGEFGTQVFAYLEQQYNITPDSDPRLANAN